VPTEKTPNPLAPEINLLFEKIRSAGFPLVGAVDLDLAKDAFLKHGERYKDWLGKGHHGEMSYLERGLARRLDPRIVFPEANAVITCAIPYRRNPSTSNPNEEPRYARYLEGPDYHKHLPELLSEALKSWSEENGPAKWKICVDTSAVLERSWAALAGLGWIGKNTLLIHPKLGSYLFIATILIDRKTGLAPALLPNYCGNCTACLDGCPTSAFVAPGELNARKCISYLTLEKRGEWNAADITDKKATGTWIAGCDICQEVCPYNRKAVRLPESWPEDPRDSALIREWTALESETEERYRERVKTSALSRVKFSEARRNFINAKENKEISS
jgi:epoxyqueuosine reductase